MSDLSIFEKMKFEKLFDMGTGYVLDFSNASFQRFILGTVGIDIEQEKYDYRSNSKANRLRAFWDRESNSVVGDLLSKLLEYWKTKRITTKSEINKAEQTLFDECNDIVGRLINDKGKSGTTDDDDQLSDERNIIHIIGNNYYYNSSFGGNTIGKVSKKIFISYRRDDSADVAGRIYDRLVQSVDKKSIFKDVNSIPFGLDFRDVLDDAVKNCDIFLVIIGNQWLELKNADGNRRIDDPMDFVKIEIEFALKRKIPVIPILVQGASMPPTNKLPPEIKELAYRNGIQVRPDPDFHKDMDRLISKL